MSMTLFLVNFFDARYLEDLEIIEMTKTRSVCIKKHGSLLPFICILLNVLLTTFFIDVKTAYSQVSLSSSHIKNDVVISHDGKSETYTLIRHAYDEMQWYYIPNSPRLGEVKINGVTSPEINLLQYKYRSRNDQTGLVEAAQLSFSVTLALPTSVYEALRTKLESFGGKGQNLKLAPLPIKRSEAVIYLPQKGDLVTHVQGDGVAGNYESQKVVFLVSLTKAGADFAEALIKGPTGIPIAFTITYQGLTPPSRLEVTADYKKIASHYSKDIQLRRGATVFGLFGVGSGIGWKSVEESLARDGALIIKRDKNEEVSDESMESIMQGVLKRINDNVFQTLSPPDKNIEAASVDKAAFAKKWFSLGYNGEFKKFRETSQYTDKFIYEGRNLTERRMLVSGFLGVGTYSKEVQEKVVTVVPESDSQAYLILPPVGTIPGLSQYVLETSLSINEEPKSSQSALWTPKNNWESRGIPTSIMRFDIPRGTDKANVKLVFKHRYIQNQNSVEIKTVKPFLSGDVMVFPPETAVGFVELDTIALPWVTANNDGKLLKVQASMESNGKVYGCIIRPEHHNEITLYPKPYVWILPKKEIDDVTNKITVTLLFEYGDGTTVRKTIDNIKDTDPSLSISLFRIAKKAQ